MGEIGNNSPPCIPWTNGGYPGALPIEDENDSIIHLEPRPFRPFKTSEEYLYAMREDLAEWLNNLYQLEICVDSFFEKLETGVVLCKVSLSIK